MNETWNPDEGDYLETNVSLRRVAAKRNTALRTRKYRVARQKNPKGSPPPMSATNKGHIKTGHKTMIYVLSLMRLLSVRPSVGESTHVRPYAPMSSLSLFFSRFITSPLSSFPLIIFLIVPLLVLLLLLLLLLRRPPLLYRFRQIAPIGSGDDRFVTWKK